MGPSVAHLNNESQCNESRICDGDSLAEVTEALFRYTEELGYGFSRLNSLEKTNDTVVSWPLYSSTYSKKCSDKTHRRLMMIGAV